MQPTPGSSSRAKMTAPAASPKRIETVRSVKSLTVLRASQPTTATIRWRPERIRLSAMFAP